MTYDVIFHLVGENAYFTCPAVGIFGAYLRASVRDALMCAMPGLSNNRNVFATLSNAELEGDHIRLRHLPSRGYHTGLVAYDSEFGHPELCCAEMRKLFPGPEYPCELYVKFGKTEPVYTYTFVCARHPVWKFAGRSGNEAPFPLTGSVDGFLNYFIGRFYPGRQVNSLNVSLSTAPYIATHARGFVIQDNARFFRSVCMVDHDDRVVKFCRVGFDKLFPENPKAIFAEIFRLS